VIASDDTLAPHAAVPSRAVCLTVAAKSALNPHSSRKGTRPCRCSRAFPKNGRQLSHTAALLAPRACLCSAVRRDAGGKAMPQATMLALRVVGHGAAEESTTSVYRKPK
jgi:hypothetical protein